MTGEVGRAAQLFALVGGEPALVEVGTRDAGDAYWCVAVAWTTTTQTESERLALLAETYR
jgi:hypothetical protein